MYNCYYIKNDFTILIGKLKFFEGEGAAFFYSHQT